VYVVERTAKPLTGYSATRLTGTPNQDVKALRNTASTLGLPGASANTGTVNDSAATYDSNWYLTTNRGYGDYNDDTHHSTTNGATAQYTFTGTGIQLLSERNGDMGTADVYLDNVLQANVNFYVSGPRQSQQVVFAKAGLSNGSHTIKVVNRSTSVVIIDAFVIA
jgi:alpha-L-fucosidase 2